MSHKDRLLSRLSREGRGSTPERVEFEASVEEEEQAGSLMLDEDEWTDRNFGSSSLVLEENGKMEKQKKENEKGEPQNLSNHGDTSEDAISDLDTDTDSESEEDEEEPGSRPLTSNEARQLQKEWIKRYDPEAVIDDDDDDREEKSQYENAPKNKGRRRSNVSYSDDDEATSDTESNDSAEESSDDYDGEYESVTTSSDDDDDEAEEVRRNVGRIPATSQPRTTSTKKRTAATRNNRITADDNEGTSTEVGSEDLSSDEDTDDDDDDDMSDFGSDFSSGSATECEFTDSEGRPNPFHKQLEVPDIVVEPGSPAMPPRHKRGTVLDQMLLERPAAPAQKMMLVTSNDGGGGMSSMTYDSRLQYKTPNVTDRVRTEQTKDQSLVQDFSTRRALNLKKNWVSEADPANKAGNSNPSSQQKKNSEAALAEIDNRLKSLMDRLSNQQKLLKPAEKPSSEMQHFLSSTSSSQQNNASMASSASTSALLESSSSAITSPTTVTSPPATTAFLRSPPAAPSTSQNNNSNQRFMQGAMPKAYRSMTSEKAFEEVESIAVPELPEASTKGAKITSGSSDFETDDDVKDEKAESSQDVVAPEADKIPHLTSVAALPNESSSFGDEFESCNEGDDNVEAVNPSLLILNESNNANEESSIFATPDQEGPPPPANPPPPLATSSPYASSPYASMEQQIDFIDSEDKSESTAAEAEEPKPQPEEQKPKPLLFGHAEVTSIYREKDHKERLAKYSNFREKEKSVVADLILNNSGGMGRRSNGNRSSSAVTRSRRVLPQSGPPPPPPNEEAATTPIRRPPPPKRQESAPAAKAKSSGALDNEGDGVQLRKNVRNKGKKFLTRFTIFNIFKTICVVLYSIAFFS